MYTATDSTAAQLRRLHQQAMMHYQQFFDTLTGRDSSILIVNNFGVRYAYEKGILQPLHLQMSDLIAGKAPAEDIKVNYELLKKKDQVKAAKLLNKALARIKQKDPAFYEYSIQTSAPTFYMRYGSGAVFNAGANTVKNGSSKSGNTTRSANYRRLDLRDIVYDPVDPTVIMNATLISWLTPADSSALGLAMKAKSITSSRVVQNLIAMIRVRTPLVADTLTMYILKGVADQKFINRLYYEVGESVVNNYITIANDPREVYLNYNVAVESGADEFTKIVAHELRYLYYPRHNPLAALKWSVIRDKHEEAPAKYRLADKLKGDKVAAYDFNNSCSEGPGHERHNPETKEVCTYGESF